MQDELCQLFSSTLQDEGLTAPLSEQLAKKLSRQFINTFSGERLYISKKIILYSQIREKFTGNNHRALAQEFDLTVRQIYTILHG